MYFRHADAIWADFPALAAGLLLAPDVSPAMALAGQADQYIERAQARLAGASESELPEIQAWRRAYAQMGMKPTQYRSAAEALLRRLRREGSIPRLHPLVDLSNALSLAWALPVAVIDLDQVDSFIEVRYADGDEQYLAWSGEVERPAPGEVIFADASRAVHARRWTFRQSRQSTVSDATRRALIVSEGLHSGAANDVAALIGALADELAGAGHPDAGRAMLTAAAPTWQLPLPG
jgi:DNA/RNA-binding domain of Phe-tRNA-synthetase-like protein